MDGEVLSVAQKNRRHIDDRNLVGFSYGNFESDRDNDSGYPSSASSKDIHEFA